MYGMDAVLNEVARRSFIAGFFVGAAFVGIAVLVGVLF